MKRKFFMMGIGLCLSSLSINVCAASLSQDGQQVMSLVQESTSKEDYTAVEVTSTLAPLTQENVLQLLDEEEQSKAYENILRQYTITEISLEWIAKVMCDKLEISPVYLPEKQTVPNGYIGRLVVDGLWTKVNDPAHILTIEEVIDLLKKGQEYSTLKGQVEKPKKYQETIPLYFKTVSLGTLEKASTQLMYEGATYELYSYDNTTYIPIAYLKALGFTNEQQTNTLRLFLKGEAEDSLPNLALKGKFVTTNTQKVFVGNLLTYSLVADGQTLIPIRAINTYYELMLQDQIWSLFARENQGNEWLFIDEEHINNIGLEPLDIELVNLFWDGDKLIKEPLHIEQLQPNQKYLNPTKLYGLHKNIIYLTTIVEKVATSGESFELPYTIYGQGNESFLKRYTQKTMSIQEGVVKEHFPASLIIGTMKNSNKGLNKGDKVEVLKAEDGVCYWVKKDNKTIVVPWGSVSIPKDPPVEKKRAEVAQIEEHINSKNFTSKTHYLVWTDLYRQRTYIFKGKVGEWKLYKEFLCSTGRNKTPTPRGVYSLRAYVPYFGVDKGYRCKNAVQIFDDYLYHSLIFDKTGSYLLEGKGVLGQRASQGCIRFSVSDSEWFYKNMPLGTTVWIN